MSRWTTSAAMVARCHTMRAMKAASSSIWKDNQHCHMEPKVPSRKQPAGYVAVAKCPNHCGLIKRIDVSPVSLSLKKPCSQPVIRILNQTKVFWSPSMRLMERTDGLPPHQPTLSKAARRWIPMVESSSYWKTGNYSASMQSLDNPVITGIFVNVLQSEVCGSA